MKCPICEGEGQLVEFSEPELGTYSNNCGACKATGDVGIRWLLSHWFWTHVPVSFVEWYGERLEQRANKGLPQ